jgi:hypothetical protein
MGPTRTYSRQSFYGCLIRWVSLWIALGWWLSPARGSGSSPAVREYDLKAALLYNLVKYTDWPADAFAAPSDPIVIGVLGNDPFGQVLDEMTRGRLINGRPISIRRAGGAMELKGSHVVFISPSESHRVPQLCTIIESFRALTIDDTDQGASFTAVNFALEGDRIVFAVDLSRTERVRVTISSNILRLAKVVAKPGEKVFR